MNELVISFKKLKMGWSRTLVIHLQASHNQELLAPGGSQSILLVAKLILGGTKLILRGLHPRCIWLRAFLTVYFLPFHSQQAVELLS